MKRVLKVFLIIIIILATIIGVFLSAAFLTLNIEINKDKFELSAKKDMPVSEYDKNGSDWGHNQSKLASIGDVIFTFHFDNSNLANGNSSDTNPYYVNFIMIVDKEEYQFGIGNANRPGNVLADEVNNKVYYILSEPAGPASNDGYDFSSFSQTVMYEYDFNVDTLEIILNEKHIVTPVSSDGKIRQGVDMDDSGNIAIAYGKYGGEMIIYTYNYSLRTFSEYTYQSNNDGDNLMYCNVAMLDLDHIYILAEQDTSIEDQTFYQYVMFFALEEGVWSSEIIVDYRDSDLADKHSEIVINSDIEIFDGVVHMAATSQLAKEVTYYTYELGELIEQDTDYLPKGTGNIKFIEIDGELFIATMSFTLRAFLPTFSITSVSEENIVYKMILVVNNRYFYVDVLNDNSVTLLIYSNSKGRLYTLE